MDRSLDASDLINCLKNKFFQTNWLQIPPAEAYFEEAKDMIVLDIISAANEILKYYHLLFLSGEYILLNKSDEEFAIIENYLIGKRSEIDNLRDENLKLELQSKFHDNIIYPFRMHIKPIIIYFLRDLNIQLNFEYKQGIFRGDKVANNSVDIDESVLGYISSFKRLITVIRYEHFRNYLDNELLRDLLVIRKESDYFSINESLKKAIYVKVSFLLKKILYRRKLSNVDATIPKYIYSFDQEDDAILSLEKIDIDSTLVEWDDLIKIHYGVIDNFKSEQRKRRREIEAKVHSEYNYKDYHGLIKIFKDDTKILNQAESLLELFDDRDNDDLKLNSYSRICTSAYLFNNCISLTCDKKSISSDEFRELLFAIKNRQNRDEVRNYFPWLKLAERMTIQIDKVSADLSDPNKYKIFKELLELFSKVVEKLEEAFNWSLYKKFIPIQMPNIECQSSYKISIEDFKPVNLFFFSSFVLPLDYNKITKDKNLVVSKKNSYKELLSVYDRLQDVFGEVADVSEKMRKQERRSIEILAIFSAVALFSVGSIQIFSVNSVNKDPHVYYKFIMSFGYSLSLFVLLIWIITRDNIKKIQGYHWIIVALFFIGTCISIGYFVGSPFFEFFNSILEVKKK